MKAIKTEKLNKNRIKVIGAREHNLKNITVEIPKDPQCYQHLAF